ncbi:MAG: hypothetical protein PHD83_06210 [Caldisericia bacterium]|nr:hypothetical protein [Caldisericia bacterium]
MRNVKLFLASGNVLKKDRDEIMLFLANKNQFLVKHGVFLELVRWEFLSSSFSETRKQDDFNKVLDESEIFTCLIFDRIGQYTREEFDKAYQNYKQGKNPRKFYLYFKTLPKGKREEAIEVYELRQAIEKDEQIYREYKNPDQLKLFLNQNLDEDLPEILKEALLQNIYDTDAKPMTETMPDHIIDNLEEADKLLSKTLTEEALEVYQESLKQINKRTNPDTYGRIQLGIGICYINLSYASDQEKNLLKAILKLEEALQYIDPTQNMQNYLLSLANLSSIYYSMASLRDRKKNINKAIEIAEKAIAFKNENNFPELYSDIYRIIGSCYKELMVLDSQKELFDKIHTYYQQALKLTDKNKNRVQYANILTALANSHCYYSLIELDKEKKIALLHESIKIGEEALELNTFDEDAISYVVILDCLSNSNYYLNGITHNLDEMLKSVEFIKKELTILKDFMHTVTYLTALSNYSMGLIRLFDQTKEISYLDESIASSKLGLEKTTLQTQPIRFSKFHVNIGIGWYKKGLILENPEDKKHAFKETLAELEDASNIFTKAQFLIGYKSIRNYETGCYIQLSKLEHKEENLAKAQEKVNDLLACYAEGEKDGFFENIEKLQTQINQEKQ